MLAIVLSVCSLVFLIFWTKNKDYWSKRNVEQVNQKSWHFLFGKYSLAEVYKHIYDSHPLQNCVGTFIGRKPALILRNLDDVQAVLQSDFQSFYARGFNTNPKDVLTDHLLLINDHSRWKLVRQKVTPLFTALKLKHMFSTIERCASDFVTYIERNKHTDEDMFQALHTYTSASISASVFGINEGTHNTMESPIIGKGWNKVSSVVSFNIKFGLSNICPRLYNFLNLKAFSEHKEFFVGILKEVLNYRSKMADKRHDFIDICLDLKKQGVMEDKANGYRIAVSDDVLAAQAFSFFIAGVDTAASSLNFTLLELSNNGDILRRLHDEIDSFFDKCEDNINFEELKDMKYLDMVINESVRKYPPIALMQRMCTRDTVLPSDNLKIEKNTIVIVPIFAIHRDEKYFPNPDVFDPDRFIPENMEKIQKFSYLPYGEGNRICLGSRFAHLQMKACLAMLLRRYTLKGCNYRPQSFDPSFFSLRDSKASYKLISRNYKK